MINLFCIQIENLYGARYDTFNAHSLTHLTDKVLELGPLWAQSCFFYEDLNGDFRSLFHGTSQVHDQVMMAVSVQQKIPELALLLYTQCSSEVVEFYTSMSRSKQVNKKEQISEEIFILGRIDSHLIIGQNKLRLIKEKFGEIVKCYSFYRLILRNHIIHSIGYSVAKKQNSYTICYEENRYGFIVCFLKCYKVDGTVLYLALLKKLSVVESKCRTLNSLCHMKIVKNIQEMDVISVDNIQHLCIYLEVENSKF